MYGEVSKSRHGVRGSELRGITAFRIDIRTIICDIAVYTHETVKLVYPYVFSLVGDVVPARDTIGRVAFT